MTKKQGVSGQSVDPGKKLEKPSTEKDFRTKHLIKEALMENDFLKNLSSSQVRDIIDHMTSKKIAAGAYVIREGESYNVCLFSRKISDKYHDNNKNVVNI